MTIEDLKVFSIKKVKFSDFAKLILLLASFLLLATALIFYKTIFILSTPVFSSFWIFYGVVVSVYLISRIPYAYLYEDRHRKYPNSSYPSVSVVIAAKNEEKSIFKTISKCVESEYPAELEFIIVDDGSTDGTKNEVTRAKKIYGDKIKLISFPKHYGKREAMASGVDEAENDVIVFVDSDSFLSPNAIRHITEHFIADESIGAVAGNTKVENADTNLLTKMQSVQYAISFDVYKTGESVHKAVTCCPGCFSAYRKIAIKPLIQKWKEQEFLGVRGTFGDDRGLTNFVLRDWNVVYCEKAKGATMVPEQFPVYWRQQLRWKKSWIREGILAGAFMWKRHPFASIGFYINFSFPFLGPILALKVLILSVQTGNPALFGVFMVGFILVGMTFALFVRIYRGAKNWFYMPLFSTLFISTLIWQMIYAFLTLRDSRWGTR